MSDTAPSATGESGPTVDDLDRELMDQLHAATLKASDLCYEMKKLCATVLAPAAAVVAVLSDKQPSVLFFAVGLLVVLAFWLADSVGFFYQRRLRNQMAEIWKRRAARCQGDEEFRVPQVSVVSPLRAAFDASMLYYLVMASVIVIGALTFVISRAM